MDSSLDSSLFLAGMGLGLKQLDLVSVSHLRIVVSDLDLNLVVTRLDTSLTNCVFVFGSVVL